MTSRPMTITSEKWLHISCSLPLLCKCQLSLVSDHQSGAYELIAVKCNSNPLRDLKGDIICYTLGMSIPFCIETLWKKKQLLPSITEYNTSCVIWCVCVWCVCGWVPIFLTQQKLKLKLSCRGQVSIPPNWSTDKLMKDSSSLYPN